MNDCLRDAARLQRWMQAVIMHPEGVSQGVDSTEARHHVDISIDQLEDLICRSERLTSRERLSIYGNAYYARLLECLRSVFPQFAKAVGDDAFDELGVGYLQSYPSRSYTLDALGANFPDYLQETRPDRDAESGQREAWPDFLIELATLEWAIHQVFDGPGDERQPAWSFESVRHDVASRWPNVQLLPSPSLRLLSFRFPVNDHYTSLRQATGEHDRPTVPDPEPTWLAITRRDYVVRRHPLRHSQFALLSQILSGEKLGRAIAEAAAVEAGLLDHFSRNLQEWFCTWMVAGFFVGVTGEPQVARSRDA